MGFWKRHFSSKHLDSGDMLEGAKPAIKIVAVGDADPDETDGEKKMLITFKPSPSFACKKTTWVCSRTIGYQLAAMFGDDDAKWIGRVVNVFAAPIRDGEAVRIYGSPEIDRDVTIKVRDFGGKKTWTMKAMPKQGKPAPQTTDAPAREPGAEG